MCGKLLAGAPPLASSTIPESKDNDHDECNTQSNEIRPGMRGVGGFGSGHERAGAAAQAPNWQTYSYPVDGFSASFPAQPEEQKKNVDTDAGPIELRSYVGTDGDVAVIVGVSDYGNATAGKNPDDGCKEPRTEPFKT